MWVSTDTRIIESVRTPSRYGPPSPPSRRTLTRSRPPHGSSALTFGAVALWLCSKTLVTKSAWTLGVARRHGRRYGDADDQPRHHDPAHARDPPAYAERADHEEGQHHDRGPQHHRDAQHDGGDLEPCGVEGEVEGAVQIVGQEERSGYEGRECGDHGHQAEQPASGPPEPGTGHHGRHQRDRESAAHRGRATEPGSAASRAARAPAFARRRPTHREPRTDSRGAERRRDGLSQRSAPGSLSPVPAIMQR